jgi:hypothetical protein
MLEVETFRAIIIGSLDGYSSGSLLMRLAKMISAAPVFGALGLTLSLYFCLFFKFSLIFLRSVFLSTRIGVSCKPDSSTMRYM